MIKSSITTAILVLTLPCFAKADEVYLLVGASAQKPAVIAEKARDLRPFAPNGLVVMTQDCSDATSLFAFVMTITSSRSQAQRALKRARDRVGDAFIRRCALRSSSLLSLRINAVDPSIADVPQDAVNWSDGDRVSSALPLGEQTVFVAIRHFVREPNDPLEGRRVRVLLAGADGRRVTLANDCLGVGNPVRSGALIAFDCVRESVADQQLLHATLVVSETGRLLDEIKRCRRPAWIAPRRLRCQAESVNGDGELVLKSKQIDLFLRGAAGERTWPTQNVER